MEACYIINERIKVLAEAVMGGGTEFKLTPGQFTIDDATSLDGIGVYTIVPNLDYGQPYINVDAIHMQIFHCKFDTLGKIIRAVAKDLNSENPQVLWSTDEFGFPVGDNRTVYELGIAEGIKYQDVVVRAGKIESKDFIEGTDFFVATVDILVQYVEL